jgi:transcription elongation factor Elf1
MGKSSGAPANIAVTSPLGTEGVDWLFDAPIPCPTCGKEAIAKIAMLKALDSITCRYCGARIDLTDAGTRAFIDEFSSVMAGLLWRDIVL